MKAATTTTTVDVDRERLSFVLPPELEAREPPEARGVARDGVRMLVAAADGLTDTTFDRIPEHLRPGDLVVVNTSATIPAAVDATAADGTPLVLHLSSDLGGGVWVVEPRRPDGSTTARWTGPLPGRELALCGGGRATLLGSYRGTRLWTARFDVGEPVLTWLAGHGRPIRYGYVPQPWPLDAYQNVYATEPGSAEMPSAGRPFTADVIMRLVARGVSVSPIVLHTGVASLEADELPYPERFVVPASTAAHVNATHDGGGRVIAIGTTVVRALESAVGSDGRAEAADGWTDVVITPERGVRLVDGLLTGWHEPEASHLLMLEGVAGRDLVARSYEAGLALGYRWHEFGDSHLLLP
jgi:S-adenosylmethionine:tRNA ribosyltransferase-isomerase